MWNVSNRQVGAADDEWGSVLRVGSGSSGGGSGDPPKTWGKVMWHAAIPVGLVPLLPWCCGDARKCRDRPDPAATMTTH